MTVLISDFMNGGGEDKAIPAEVSTSAGVRSEQKLLASTFQQHFVLLHLMQPDTAAYSLPFTYSLPTGAELPEADVLHLLQAPMPISSIYCAQK